MTSLTRLSVEVGIPLNLQAMILMFVVKVWTVVLLLQGVAAMVRVMLFVGVVLGLQTR